jgi:hypothetical protein
LEHYLLYGYERDARTSGGETLVIKGTNPKSEYVLVYNVKRDIKNTQEKFTLHKEGDSIKIVGYDIRF